MSGQIITCGHCGERERVPGHFTRTGRPGDQLAQCAACGGMERVEE